MKKIILIIGFVVITLCLFSQNHRHNTPYRSESSNITRMDTTVYEEKVTVLSQGLSTTTEVEIKALYNIPKHLRKLHTHVIDDVVRKCIPYVATKWSWFVIWERTYTKNAAYDQFSYRVLVNLLFVYGGILLFYLLVIFLMKRNFKGVIRELMDIKLASLDKEFWQVFSAMFILFASIVAFIVTVLQDDTADIDVLFGLMIYNSVLVVVFYLVVTVIKKIKSFRE